MLQSHQPDDCCGAPLERALHAGALDQRAEWACPKCGCEWLPRIVGVMRHWEPVSTFFMWSVKDRRHFSA